ncbi:MAG: STM3941 family protein [Propionicimonas sp.]
MERIVVQASPARVVGLGLACLGFTAAGVWMLLSGDWLGWLPIAFFGGVGAWGLTRMWRQRIHLIATADGLTIGTGGFVPWRDVAAIGVGRSSGARVLGVRLARYDNYLQSLTPRQLRLIRRVAGFGSGAGAMLVPLQPGSDAASLLELDGRSVAGVLRWTRRRSGFDLVWGSAAITGSVEQLADQLQSLRSRYGEGTETAGR